MGNKYYVLHRLLSQISRLGSKSTRDDSGLGGCRHLYPPSCLKVVFSETPLQASNLPSIRLTPCASADRRIGSKRKLQARRGKRDGRRRSMGSPTSVTTENHEPPRGKGGAGPRGDPKAATGGVDVAHYSNERPSRGPWPSEAPPTGVLTGVLGELAFYYGACWLHYRSAPLRPGKTR